VTEISDEYMKAMLPKAKSYTAVILRKTEVDFKDPEIQKTIWEHGRRNFTLRADAIMPIVCPVNDKSDVAGIAILDTTSIEAKKIMDADPAVQKGIFTYELHPCRGFPGSALI
jgi:hypothetical protein